MAESRMKNAARNVVFALLNKVVSIVMPFVTRTIVLYILGSKYLGLSSLFSSILSFLSLTELGLGSAIVHSMYKPVAGKDTGKICALLSYYRNFYRIIGIAILAIGSGLAFFLPQLIKGTPPEGANIYILFFIYLANSSVGYFLAAYKQSLLTAHQRSDITSKINIVVHLVMQVGQIVVLIFTQNYYVFAALPILSTLLVNAFSAVITNKMYPQYKCKGKLDKASREEIQRKISGLIGTKLNSVVVHSADAVVVSAFLGLIDTAMYDNYYYIINSISAFIIIFFASMTAGTGNSIVTETVEKNRTLFNKLTIINAWGVGWCSVCLLCLLHPFMTIWVGDNYVFPMTIELLFVCYFFIYNIQRVILMFKDACGLWYEDRFRPYVAMTTNVILNITLVQVIGVYGIILSSIIAFLISVPWANNTLFKHYFGEPGIKNIFRMLQDTVATAVIGGATFFSCRYIPSGIGFFIVRIIVCIILPNILFWLYFRSKEGYEEVTRLIQSKLKIRVFIRRKKA